MASSNSSSLEEKCPENFQVSGTTNDDEDDDVCDVVSGVLVKHKRATTATASRASKDAAEALQHKCPLCCIASTKFHCRSCVKNGNIFHHAAANSTSQFNER